MSGSTPDGRVLCRDCLNFSAALAQRCEHCGSPRLLRHPERDTLSVAHIDCDAFYATIEKRDNRELMNKPVIVGGGIRGVVSTCCYIARTFGVRSAMPMFKARQLCPDAVIIKPDMAKYAAVSRQMRTMMETLTPLVEPVSIDEAFLDLSGTEALHGASAAHALARLARVIEDELGITVSIGLSDCKFLAKIASDMQKPRGFTIIGRAEAVGFLRAKPVGLIFGVGAVTQARLEKAGYRLIGDLQDAGPARLMAQFGDEGQRLARLALGDDKRRVTPFRETKSVSAETTFAQDLSRLEELEPILLRLCERVALRLRRADLCGGTITLKLKTARFASRTRALSQADPTALSTRLFAIGRDLLKAELDGTPFRLIGIGVSNLQKLEAADPQTLLNPNLAREKATELAVMQLRAKFGDEAVSRGLAFRPKKK